MTVENKIKDKPILMKCRRGSDRLTAGQTCDGMFVKKHNQDGSTEQRYTCEKCRYTWTVGVGGVFQY
jgi:transposase-like protein